MQKRDNSRSPASVQRQADRLGRTSIRPSVRSSQGHRRSENCRFDATRVVVSVVCLVGDGRSV